jgi:DNA-binding transcriptional LysR family regulator
LTGPAPKRSLGSLHVGARQTLAPQGPFVAATLRRTFVIHSSDYVLTILGATVDRMLTQQAPGVHVRFIANSIDDPAQLRDGGSDLAVGIYGDLPQEMRSRQLITDRFVCVVRAGHPFVGRRLSLQQFTGISHVQIAPRGKPGGYVDDVLRAKGHTRTVARAVPYFLTALQLTAETDYLLTISERIATRLAPALGLRILEIPLVLRPYALSLVWHPRFDGDAGHRFLRETFALAADQNHHRGVPHDLCDHAALNQSTGPVDLSVHDQEMIDAPHCFVLA